MSYLLTDPNSPQTLWQHNEPGLGLYRDVGDYSWEYFGPNAFAWEAPADSAPQPAPILGMGGCGCGGKCGGCGDHKHGVGQTALPAIPAPGGGIFGTGLFANTDISTWGWPEWAAVAGVLYLGTSLLGDVKSGATRAKRTYRRITS